MIDFYYNFLEITTHTHTHKHGIIAIGYHDDDDAKEYTNQIINFFCFYFHIWHFSPILLTYLLIIIINPLHTFISYKLETKKNPGWQPRYDDDFL